MKTTVVYYTSNREDESFEKKIQENLLKVIGNLPLISVSQKPIDFGKNICVGDVGVSNQNMHRQLQIGAMAATTPFIHFAQANTLYSKAHFKYLPPVKNRIYRTPVYLLYLKHRNFSKDQFYYKQSSEASTVVGRIYIIEHIESYLSGRGMWYPERENGSKVPKMITSLEMFSIFSTKVPVIYFKTGKGLHGTHAYSGIVKTLPYRGTSEEVINKFL